MNINTSTGPDEISSLFIKKCCSILVEPIYILYNKIVSQGFFPMEWKIAFVVTNFEAGDKSNVQNSDQYLLLTQYQKY